MPPTNEGNAGVYIGATGHRPLPKYDGRRPHAPAKRQPTGLDWDAIRATQPQQTTSEPKAALTSPCKTCGEHSSELHDGLCPLCVDEAAAKFTVPTVPVTVPEPPTEGKQGKPATGSSAPGVQARSTTGRAPVAGPSTHREKDPEVAQETRPAATSGPSVESFNADVDRTVGLNATGAADQLDTLIDAIAQIRATAATELARIENALEAIRSTLAPAAPLVVPAHIDDSRTTGFQIAPKPKAGHGRPIKLDDTKVAEICRRYQAGEPATALAQAFDVSQPTILHRLRQNGITIRPRGGTPSTRTNQSGAQSA